MCIRLTWNFVDLNQPGGTCVKFTFPRLSILRICLSSISTGVAIHLEFNSKELVTQLLRSLVTAVNRVTKIYFLLSWYDRAVAVWLIFVTSQICIWCIYTEDEKECSKQLNWKSWILTRAEIRGSRKRSDARKFRDVWLWKAGKRGKKI